MNNKAVISDTLYEIQKVHNSLSEYQINILLNSYTLSEIRSGTINDGMFTPGFIVEQHTLYGRKYKIEPIKLPPYEKAQYGTGLKKRKTGCINFPKNIIDVSHRFKSLEDLIHS